MGQFALGLRSLLIKSTIFVIMAALLAWALGGTLWPRPHIADLRLSRTPVGTQVYFWRVSQKDRLQEFAAWQLMIKPNAMDEAKPADEREWFNGAGPIVTAKELHFGGCDASGQWTLVKLSLSGERTVNTLMPDRLAVEQQLARLAAGLPMQDAETILKQRGEVLDPSGAGPLHPALNPADKSMVP